MMKKLPQNLFCFALAIVFYFTSSLFIVLHAQCTSAFTIDINGCTVTGVSQANEQFFNIWTWGDGSSNQGTGQEVVHDYACGIYTVSHTVFCDSNNDGIDEEHTTSQQITISKPVVGITASITNQNLACNETATIKYKLCRLLCNGIPSPVINVPMVFTVTVPNGLQVAGGDFSQSGNNWTYTIPANSLTDCIEADIKVMAQTGGDFVVTLTAPVVSCVTFHPETIKSTIHAVLPNLTITKTALTPNVQPGGTASYKISIKNIGSAQVQGIQITDVFPSGLVPTVFPAGAVVTADQIIYTIASINAGGVQETTLSFKANSMCGDFQNCASAAVPACNYQTAQSCATVSLNTTGITIIDVPDNANLSDIIVANSPLSNPVFMNISGVLNVDQSYIFPPGSIFQMGNGAEIRVKGGKYFWIQGAHLYSCDKLWKGITLEQNSSLFSYNSLIEDAKYAVYVEDDANLTIYGTVFSKNYIGIFAPQNTTSFPLTDGQHNSQFWTLSNNTFQSPGNIRAKYDDEAPVPASNAHSFAGMVLNDVPAFNLINAGADVTIFRDMSYGIKTFRTNLKVGRTRFINILPGAYNSTGYGIRAEGAYDGIFMLSQSGFGNGTTAIPSFENCHYGISGLQIHANIQQNRMTQVSRGIQIGLAKNKIIDIYHNRIACTYYGIGLPDNNPATSINVNNNVIDIRI